VIKEPPVETKIGRDTGSFQYVFHQLTLETNPFEPFWTFRNQIKQAILEMLTKNARTQLEMCRPPEIGVHIRRGDFKKGSVITPIDFFVKALEHVRKSYGESLGITVFSDGTDAEIQAVLNMPHCARAPKRMDIVDILVLAQSRYMVISSGSTFGYWAAFLSTAKVIRPKDWLPRIAPDREDGYRETILDLNNYSFTSVIQVD
jgi:hypothetical protein